MKDESAWWVPTEFATAWKQQACWESSAATGQPGYN